MDNLIIRKASTEDAEGIIEYLNVIGGESDNLLFGANELNISLDREKALIEAMNNSERDLMLIATVSDEIASVATLQGFGRKRISHRASIAISVRKKFWNKGIGGRMIKELVAFAKKAGITVIELEVKSDNIAAVSLYEKLGFENIGVYKKFFYINGEYFDAYLMNLYL